MAYGRPAAAMLASFVKALQHMCKDSSSLFIGCSFTVCEGRVCGGTRMCKDVCKGHHVTLAVGDIQCGTLHQANTLDARPALVVAHLTRTLRLASVQYGLVNSNDGSWHAHRLARHAGSTEPCTLWPAAHGEAAVLPWLAIDAGGWVVQWPLSCNCSNGCQSGMLMVHRLWPSWLT